MTDGVTNPTNAMKERLKEPRFIVSGVAVIATVVALILAYRDGSWTPPADRWMAVTLFVLWSVGPPIWFLLEWTFKGPDPRDKDKFDKFKYSQDLAKNVWAGFTVALGVLLVIK